MVKYLIFAILIISLLLMFSIIYSIYRHFNRESSYLLYIVHFKCLPSLAYEIHNLSHLCLLLSYSHVSHYKLLVEVNSPLHLNDTVHSLKCHHLESIVSPLLSNELVELITQRLIVIKLQLYLVGDLLLHGSRSIGAEL